MTATRRNLRAAVYARDGGVCAACPPGLGPAERWEADHVVPLELGGADTLANVQTLCAGHHRAKTAHDARRIAEARRGREAGAELGLALAEKQARGREAPRKRWAQMTPRERIEHSRARRRVRRERRRQARQQAKGAG